MDPWTDVSLVLAGCEASKRRNRARVPCFRNRARGQGGGMLGVTRRWPGGWLTYLAPRRRRPGRRGGAAVAAAAGALPAGPTGRRRRRRWRTAAGAAGRGRRG